MSDFDNIDNFHEARQGSMYVLTPDELLRYQDAAVEEALDRVRDLIIGLYQDETEGALSLHTADRILEELELETIDSAYYVGSDREES